MKTKTKIVLYYNFISKHCDLNLYVKENEKQTFNKMKMLVYCNMRENEEFKTGYMEKGARKRSIYLPSAR